MGVAVLLDRGEAGWVDRGEEAGCEGIWAGDGCSDLVGWRWIGKVEAGWVAEETEEDLE